MTWRYLCLLASLSYLALPGVAAAQACNGFDQRLCLPPDPSLQPPFAASIHLRYGDKHWQDISYYGARSSAPAPLLVVFEAGGTAGWTGWLRYRLNEAGYSVAFVRYGERVPKADAAIAAHAAAIAYLRSQAQDLGLDRDRIALFGSGSDASIAALLGTDPTLLESVGVPFGSVRAVIGYGGAGFDLTERAARSRYLSQRYRRFVGKDPADYARLSAVNHLAPPNAPALLLFAEDKDAEATAESKEAAATFAGAGIDARFVPLPVPRDGARQTFFMLEPDGSGREILPLLNAAFGRAGGVTAVSAG